ncbi:MAG: hypothetical protein HY073_00920 [Deltaproteobacteria bacterium]|nr:hypothetical protein [Deltaproteobacteria bacterium]
MGASASLRVQDKEIKAVVLETPDQKPTEIEPAEAKEALGKLANLIPAGSDPKVVKFSIGSKEVALEELRRIAGTAAPATPALWKPLAPQKPSVSYDKRSLVVKIGQTVWGHVGTALHFALENMHPSVKQRIIEAYKKPDGSFDEEKFVSDYGQVVYQKLGRLKWKDVLQQDSEAQSGSFTLGDVNPKLKKVGKDIVVGAVFVEVDEATVIRTLVDTSLYTRYGSTMGLGISKAGNCGTDSKGVYIRFGFTKEGNEVTVVNDNNNRLKAAGVQYWRLTSNPGSGCPSVNDITVNVGIQSVYPYEEGGLKGFVVTYILMATPSTQVLAERAMDNTMDSIEDIAEGRK